MANFKGEYRYTLDEKGRVNIPAKFRKLLIPEAQDTFVVTRGLDKCLFAYPLDEWEKFEAKLRGLPMTKRDNRFIVRMFMSGAAEEKYDRQGRIVLPAKLLEHAEIKKDVIIIGALERIEIWDPRLYQAYLNESGMTFEDVAENILFDNT